MSHHLTTFLVFLLFALTACGEGERIPSVPPTAEIESESISLKEAIDEPMMDADIDTTDAE